MRSSLRYVPEKDKKAVVADLKPIYQANNQDQSYEKLLEFDEKWGKKYPLSVKRWVDIGGIFQLILNIRPISVELFIQ